VMQRIAAPMVGGVITSAILELVIILPLHDMESREMRKSKALLCKEDV